MEKIKSEEEFEKLVIKLTDWKPAWLDIEDLDEETGVTLLGYSIYVGDIEDLTGELKDVLQKYNQNYLHGLPGSKGQNV